MTDYQIKRKRKKEGKPISPGTATGTGRNLCETAI